MDLIAFLILQVGPLFAMGQLGIEMVAQDRLTENLGRRACPETAGGAKVGGERAHLAMGVLGRGAHYRRRLLIAPIWKVVAQKRPAGQRRRSCGVLSRDASSARTRRPQTRASSNSRR